MDQPLTVGKLGILCGDAKGALTGRKEGNRLKGVDKWSEYEWAFPLANGFEFCPDCWWSH